MADGTRTGTVFRRVSRSECDELGHSIDALLLELAQVVVGHAIWLSHEGDIYCSMLKVV